jgi:O-antigen/teichoic acid export membrane protein
MTAGGVTADPRPAGPRSRLSGDVVGVGGGLLVLGASSYVFLTVSAHVLSPVAFSALSVLYTIVYALGPGVFLPIEQELGRALAHRRERGEGGGPVVRQATVLGLVAVVALAVALLAAGPVITRELFDGRWSLLVVLLIALVALWVAHVTRGAMAGMGRFGNYGLQLGLDGGSRAVACAVLAVIGVHSVAAYGWLIPAGVLLSVAGTGRSARALVAPGPDSDPRELTQALVWLLVASLLSQVLVNGGPVAVKALAAPDEAADAGHLLAGLVLTRVPLFLFTAVQAALLPNLAALLSRGAHAQFVSALRRLLLGLGGLTVASTAAAALWGPVLLRALFGSRFQLSGAVLAALSAGSGFYMVSAAVTQSLVALRRYAASATAWLLGAAVFLALLATTGSIVDRVSAALLLGSAVSTAVALTALLRAARQP